MKYAYPILMIILCILVAVFFGWKAHCLWAIYSGVESMALIELVITGGLAMFLLGLAGKAIEDAKSWALFISRTACLSEEEQCAIVGAL